MACNFNNDFQPEMAMFRPFSFANKIKAYVEKKHWNWTDLNEYWFKKMLSILISNWVIKVRKAFKIWFQMLLSGVKIKSNQICTTWKGVQI